MLKLTDVLDIAKLDVLLFDDQFQVLGGHQIDGQQQVREGHLLDLLPVKLRQPVDSILSEVLTLEQQLTLSIQDKDHWLCVWIARIDAGQNVLFVQRRKQRCAHERFERQRQTLFELARATAHDLSEPLRTLESFSTLLLTEFDDLSNDDRQQALEFIVKEAARMKVIVAALFEYANAATTELTVEPLALGDEIDLILTSLKQLISDQPYGVRVTKTGIPETVMADQLFLRAIYNLLSNAIKFGPTDKRTEIIIDGSLSTDSQLWLIISDNGIGIQKENLSKVFEPFRRFQPKERYKGSGLGLAITKQIVEQHHGTIEVCSTYGRGTSIIVNIPTGTGHASAVNRRSSA